MAKDESKLVESVEESTESVESTTENTADDKFNPLAFTEDVELKELITEVKEEEEETKAETEEEDKVKKYLAFSDRDLVQEELKADGMDAAEIEESLDKLEDAGMMKMKAKSIRRLINNAIETQTRNHNEALTQEEAKRKESADKAREALKGHIKDMNEFMGGKVTKKQKEEVYKFATKRMMDEIWSSHANVADVAMFMLYRKQIEKILRSQGLEDGKAAIMDSIVSPNLNSGKGKSNFKVKSGKFDPKAFMSE